MISHVLSMARAHNKILRIVVLAIEVSVMNLLAWLDGSTNFRLGNYDVLKNVSLRVSSWMRWKKDFSISILDDEGLLSEGRRTCHRAKFWIGVVCDELCAALPARKLTLLCAPLWRRVHQANVVLPTISLPEMNSTASIDGAGTHSPHALSLLRKTRALLPRPVATGITERPNGPRVNFPLDFLSTLRAVIPVHSAQYIPIS